MSSASWEIWEMDRRLPVVVVVVVAVVVGDASRYPSERPVARWPPLATVPVMGARGGRRDDALLPLSFFLEGASEPLEEEEEEEELLLLLLEELLSLLFDLPRWCEALGVVRRLLCRMWDLRVLDVPAVVVVVVAGASRSSFAGGCCRLGCFSTSSAGRSLRPCH